MDSEHWKPAYCQTSQITLDELVEGAGNRGGLELHNKNIKPGMCMEWESSVSQRDKPGPKKGEEFS